MKSVKMYYLTEIIEKNEIITFGFTKKQIIFAAVNSTKIIFCLSCNSINH